MYNLAPTRRRVSHRVFTLFLCSITLLFSTSTLHGQGTTVRVETFSLKPNGEISVENSRGSTRVEAWDYQSVRVVAEKKAVGKTLEPGELVLMGAQNSLMVQCKPGAGRIDLTLYVPINSQIQVTGASFPVDLSGPLASAVVDTTTGNIAYRMPGNDSARVRMRSALGAVRSTVPLTSVQRVGTRSLEGQIGDGLA